MARLIESIAVKTGSQDMANSDRQTHPAGVDVRLRRPKYSANPFVANIPTSPKQNQDRT